MHRRSMFSKRRHRQALATLHLQVDFQLPQRFDLEFNRGRTTSAIVLINDPSGTLQVSVERYLRDLLEHYAGALPTWLAPEQSGCCRLRRRTGLCQIVLDRLKEAGLRATLSEPDETLGPGSGRPRWDKIPCSWWLGRVNEAAGTVGLNGREREPERDVARRNA